MKGLIRVRVARTPEDMFDSLSQKEESYYRKQAAKVAKILNHKIVQSLLREVVESEDVRLDCIQDIRVNILPSMRDPEYGDHLYGWYDREDCRICIYPAVRYKGSKFLTDPLVSFQFIKESVDTLIHEVLHARYRRESTVRRLTRKYLNRFYQRLFEYME